ncbi:MAG: hypothetical protein OEV00_14150 [Acidobacteriota bacterium]|nr:hypothetical protein [Acidobacteriota bacterium]MDH3786452.1 hypothetical protein [Acidobacteriota bacterium]
MPAENAERVGKRVSALKSKMAAAGDSLTGVDRRKAAKKVRRAQRKFRRIHVPAPEAKEESAE